MSSKRIVVNCFQQSCIFAFCDNFSFHQKEETTYYYFPSRAFLQQPSINFMAGVTVGF